MNQKTAELLDRSFTFGIGMLKFLNTLPYNQVYKIPIMQLARSATSIGANYEEAQGASTRRDFHYRISISHREARETVYWLRILKDLYTTESFKSDFDRFSKEAVELRAIFASIRLSATSKS